jgi:hypothetical protein
MTISISNKRKQKNETILREARPVVGGYMCSFLSVETYEASE